MKDTFYSELSLIREKSSYNNVSMDKCKYDKFIEKVKKLKKKNSYGNDYRFLKRYDILNKNGQIKLISPIQEGHTIKYFVYDEELFDIIQKIHINNKHCGRDRMMSFIKKKYVNITYKDVQLYLNLCELCSQRLKNSKKKLTEKPMLSEEFNSKCTIDFIDFKSQVDDDYKFVLVYQDLSTNYIQLRPLKSKSVAEVCDNIINIFMILGIPSIIQANNGYEYVKQITSSLIDFFPGFKIVFGDPRYSKNLENNDTKQIIKNMLSKWMQKNKTKKWSLALRYVQLIKNSSLQDSMQKSPYEAMFGCSPKLGLSSFNLPKETLDQMYSENDLNNFIAKRNKNLTVINKEQTIPETEEIFNEARAEDIFDWLKIEINDEEEIKSDDETIQPLKRKNNDEEDIISNEELSNEVKIDCNNQEKILSSKKLIEEPKLSLKRQNKDEIFSSEQIAIKRKMNSSDKKIAEVSLGSTIKIPVPENHQENKAGRSILCIVTEILDDNFYGLGNRSSTVEKLLKK